MLRTTETLTSATELNVFTSKEVILQPQIDAKFVVEGSVIDSGDQWSPVPIEVLNSGLPVSGNGGDIPAKSIVRINTTGLSRLRFPQLAGSTATYTTRVPFDLAPQPQDFVTLGGLGDSQLASGITTTAGNDTQNLVTGRLGAMTEHNVLLWASGYSGGKLVYAGVEGTGGLTSQQIIDTHLQGALRHRWTFCAISATTNDVGAAVASATTIANIEYMVVCLLAVGTIPIIMGNLPNRLTTGAAYDALNIGLRGLANKYAMKGVIYEDAWAPYVGDDGLGDAALFRDNTHLTFAGNKTRGQNLASLILAAHPWVRDAYLPQSNATGKSGLATNPIFTANSGAVTPTGWTIGGTGVTSNVTSGAVGNDWTLTRGSANSTGNTTANIAPAGGTYIWVSRVQTTNIASAGSELGFRDPAFVAASHAWRWIINDQELPADFILAVKFAVPTGFPAQYYRVLGGGLTGGTIVHSQFELYTTSAWV